MYGIAEFLDFANKCLLREPQDHSNIWCCVTRPHGIQHWAVLRSKIYYGDTVIYEELNFLGENAQKISYVGFLQKTKILEPMFPAYIEMTVFGTGGSFTPFLLLL